MPVARFRIGIEVELLLSSKKTSGNNEPGLDKATFAAGLTTSYNKKTEPPLPRMALNLQGKIQAQPRSEWNLVDDSAVTPDKERSNQYALEIVSPILEYGTEFQWSRAVTHLWDCIATDCVIETNDTCATHVHLSPLNGTPWDIESLKSICRSIIHFEGAFEVLVPPGRRGNRFSQNNRLGSPSLIERSDQECYRKIGDCPDIATLISVMQPRTSASSGYQLRKYRAWNFLNLFPAYPGTIEFRQGPGVIDSSGCLAWVELVVSFVQAATQRGSVKSLQGYARTVEGLKTFIDAASVPGLNQPKLLTSIFENKSGYLEPTCHDDDRAKPER
ncbi:hypothetical protein MMC18_000742 [Xylographa bjoerkii]|nr:hypothetical protein [Xylographa bjoerkii]